jgi:hypothetical protein
MIVSENCDGLSNPVDEQTGASKVLRCGNDVGFFASIS